MSKRVLDYPRFIAFIIAVAAFAVSIYIVAWESHRNTIKNRQAIEKSCVLLNNAIVRSSRAQTDPESPSVPLIQGILSVIPPKYAHEYIQRTKVGTTFIPLIDCGKVANHPEAIKADQLPPAPPPPPHVGIPSRKR